VNGRLAVPAFLLLITGATELLVSSDGQGPVRIATSVGFLLLVPGWAVLRMVDPPVDLVTGAGLAIAISVGLDMAVATTLLYLRIWSVGLALAIISALVVLAILLGLPASRAAIGREARRAWAALGSVDEP